MPYLHSCSSCILSHFCVCCDSSPRKTNSNRTCFTGISCQVFDGEKSFEPTTTIIIGVLIVCYLPLVLAGIVNKFVSKSHYVSIILTLAQPVFLSFTLLNSLCNPIIYCRRNKTLRKALVELL